MATDKEDLIVQAIKPPKGFFEVDKNSINDFKKSVEENRKQQKELKAYDFSKIKRVGSGEHEDRKY